MEKLKFTVRFIALLALVPTVMYAELSRDEKVKTEEKRPATEKVSATTSHDDLLSSHFNLMQAVYN